LTTFPIEAARAEFERAMSTGHPIVVAAPTGSGKSTRLPEWLDDRGARVLVVEPRRVACRALASWVAQRREESVGESVGYRVRFGDRTGPDTRVCFVTPGVALNMIADGLRDFDVVLVDEFHERSWEIELVVALVRSMRLGGRSLGLVLCSATLDTEDLVERLDGELVVAEGRTFPVDVDYDGEGPPSDRDLDLRVAASVREALAADAEGDVLVFLPGKGEIEACRRALGDVDASGRAEVVPVHARVPPEQLQRAFSSDPSTRTRRVFLSTNVAETSLTLPGVTAVIDSGLARMRIHRAGRNVLALVPISRASMDQRAGRAGRVAAGRCLRLWSRTYAPVEVTPPEIERVELDDLVLRAAQCGLEGGALPGAPWVAPPPEFALERARERLRGLGALDERDHLTKQGRAQARVPVSAFESRVLVEVPAALASTIADLVALLEVGRDLLLPGGVDERTHEARHALLSDATNEVFVQLACLRRGDARRHGLHRVALGEARRLANSLRALVGAPKLDPKHPEAPPTPDALAELLLRRIPQAAFARRPRADAKRSRSRGPATGEPWGNGEIELSIRPYVVPSLDPDAQPKPPRTALVLDHTWIGVGQRARGVGRMLLPCTPAQIVAAGIGETSIGQPRRRGGKIVAPVEHTLAGAVLESDERPLQGAALREAIATLILQGSLRRGLGERVEDAVHLWSLIHQSAPGSPKSSGAPPIDASTYLASTLERQGLERHDDLALLEDEDLLPDLQALATAAGLSPRDFAALEADFPRTFTFESARYRCDVDLERHRVTLEPDNKAARAKNEPPVRVVPRFRGFRVEYRKASRVVKLR
jgi:ATP-dependent helicase HrpB